MMSGTEVRMCALLVFLSVGCGPAKGVGTDGETGEPALTTGASAGTTAAPTSGGTGTTEVGTATGGSTEDCLICPNQHDLPPPGEDCDPWAQDCPEGQKCTLDGGFEDAHCVEVMPDPKGDGEPCSVFGEPLGGVDDCGFGLACYPIDPDTGQGTCVPICTAAGGSDGCADPARFCWPICQSCYVGVCLDACDPRGDECPEGQVCAPESYWLGFLCIIDASGGAKQYGSECEYVNDCGAGLLCAPPDWVPGCASGSGCCTPYCDVTQPACPDAELGVECRAWYSEGQAPAGLEALGMCMLPP